MQKQKRLEESKAIAVVTDIAESEWGKEREAKLVEEVHSNKGDEVS
jgi:hypothetical protein